MFEIKTSKNIRNNKQPSYPKDKTAKKNGTYIFITIKNHKDKHGGHPHVIIEDIDDKHVSVGFTTKPKKGKNSPNYSLAISPLKDNKKSYMRRQGTVDYKFNYYDKRSGVMDNKDYEKAKEYSKSAKKRYLDKKK